MGEPGRALRLWPVVAVTVAACGARSALGVLSEDGTLPIDAGGLDVVQGFDTGGGGHADAGSEDARLSDGRTSGEAGVVLDGAGPQEAGPPVLACEADASVLIMQDLDNPNLNVDSNELQWSVVVDQRDEVEVDVHDQLSKTNWTFDFASPTNGSGLAPATYADAGSLPSTTAPAINIQGQGAGCDQSGGSFRVSALERDDAGLRVFAVAFSQSCIGAALDVSGCLKVMR